MVFHYPQEKAELLSPIQLFQLFLPRSPFTFYAQQPDVLSLASEHMPFPCAFNSCFSHINLANFYPLSGLSLIKVYSFRKFFRISHIGNECSSYAVQALYMPPAQPSSHCVITAHCLFTFL